MKGEMDKIKILCVATHIMEITRRLDNSKKLVLESFCDKIMLNKYHQDQEGNQVLLKKLLEYKNKHIDLLSVKKVSSVQFTKDAENWLERLYKRTKQTGFRDFYYTMIANASTQERQLKDNQKAIAIDKKKGDKGSTQVEKNTQPAESKNI